MLGGGSGREWRKRKNLRNCCIVQCSHLPVDTFSLNGGAGMILKMVLGNLGDLRTGVTRLQALPALSVSNWFFIKSTFGVL